MYTTQSNIIITKAKALLCGRHVKFSFYEKEIFYNTVSASRKKIQRERQEKIKLIKRTIGSVQVIEQETMFLISFLRMLGSRKIRKV